MNGLPSISDTLDLGSESEVGVDDITLEDIDLLEGKRARSSGRRLKRIRFTRDRKWLLGFGTAFLGHVLESPLPTVYEVTLTAKPAVPFRPRRIELSAVSEVFPWATAGDPLGIIWVREVKISGKSQFANSPSGFPGSAFRGEADDMLVKFDTCPPGNEIAVTLMIDDSDIADVSDFWVTVGMIGFAAGRE